MRTYEVIIRIAEYENITLAAKSLGYTQANLSHMISKTEEELKIKLFHRLRHGVKLTHAGKEILQYMKQIEALEQSMASAALAHRTSMLRVGSFYSLTAYWLPGIMSLFVRSNPETMVTIIEKESWNEIEKCVTMGEVDCAFYAGLYHTGHDFVSLYHDPYYALVSEDHPLAQKKSVSMAELQSHPFIMPSEGTGSTAIRDLISKLQVKPNLLMQTQGDLGTLMMVEKNYGFSILPGLIAKNTLQRVRAVALEEGITRNIGIISKPYSELSEVTRAFIQTAKRFAADWVPPQHED